MLGKKYIENPTYKVDLNNYLDMKAMKRMNLRKFNSSPVDLDANLVIVKNGLEDFLRRRYRAAFQDSMGLWKTVQNENIRDDGTQEEKPQNEGTDDEIFAAENKGQAIKEKSSLWIISRNLFKRKHKTNTNGVSEEVLKYFKYIDKKKFDKKYLPKNQIEETIPIPTSKIAPDEDILLGTGNSAAFNKDKKKMDRTIFLESYGAKKISFFDEEKPSTSKFDGLTAVSTNGELLPRVFVIPARDTKVSPITTNKPSNQKTDRSNDTPFKKEQKANIARIFTQPYRQRSVSFFNENESLTPYLHEYHQYL